MVCTVVVGDVCPPPHLVWWTPLPPKLSTQIAWFQGLISACTYCICFFLYSLNFLDFQYTSSNLHKPHQIHGVQRTNTIFNCLLFQLGYSYYLLALGLSLRPPPLLMHIHSLYFFYLKIFGCDAYVFIPKKKIMPTSCLWKQKKSSSLNMKKKSKDIFWSLKKRTVIVSSTVIFDELLFSYCSGK